MSTPWFIPRPSEAPAGFLLFCFAHAGGTAAAFRTWRKRLAGTAEVLALQLPGRGGRLGEKPFRRIGDAATAVAEVLEPFTAQPFVFFGHSMGGLLAFETARAIRRRGGPEPLHLFVSARRGPQIPEPDAAVSALADDAFVGEIRRRYSAVPDEVAREPELMEILLPMLRADFEMLETYQYVGSEPLRCPITAVAGENDTRATLELRRPWRDETEGGFDIQTFPGGHFYFDGPSAEAPVLSWLEDRLTAYGAASTEAPAWIAR